MLKTVLKISFVIGFMTCLCYASNQNSCAHEWMRSTQERLDLASGAMILSPKEKKSSPLSPRRKIAERSFTPTASLSPKTSQRRGGR
jgi:hypothetical protein